MTESSWVMAWRQAILWMPPARVGDQADRAAGRPHAHSVTADRRYGEPATERELRALGVDTVAIHRRAKASAARRAVAGSATSSTDTAGTAPSWTAAREPPSGAGTGIHPQPGQDQRRLPADPIWAAHRIPPRSQGPGKVVFMQPEAA